MNSGVRTVWGWPASRARLTVAAMALIVGGLVAVAVFVPFTIAHGPTSANLGNEVLGWDMHRWGFVLGSVSPLLVGPGLWLLRDLLAGGRRLACWALTVMYVVMFLVVAMTVLGQSLGPPLELFFLAPASVLAAAATDRRGAIRGLLAALAAAYAAALVLVFVPFGISEILGDFRIFGLIAYAGVGALWAALGAVVLGSALTETGPTGAVGGGDLSPLRAGDHGPRQP